MHPQHYDRLFAEAKDKEIEKNMTNTNGVGKDDKDIDAAVLNFIIKERLPLSKLESIHLKRLIQGEFVLLYILHHAIAAILTFKIESNFYFSLLEFECLISSKS